MNGTRSNVEFLMSMEELRAAPDSECMRVRQFANVRHLLTEERGIPLEAARQTPLHLQDYDVSTDPSDSASLKAHHARTQVQEP